MATFDIRPPTIVINTPGASTSTVSAPRPAPRIMYNDQATSTTSIPTLSKSTNNPSPIDTNSSNTRPKRSASIRSQTPSINNPTNAPSCYLCDEQNPGDFSPTTKHLETCLLCTRTFCPIHKSAAGYEQICNINHSTYYHEMFEKAIGTVSESKRMGTGEDAVQMRELAEEILVEEGIYPSLGEREKAIFVTSPVDANKQKEIEQYRNLDAQIQAGQTNYRRGVIEEADVIGADIAV